MQLIRASKQITVMRNEKYTDTDRHTQYGSNTEDGICGRVMGIGGAADLSAPLAAQPGRGRQGLLDAHKD
jgi:hypothetical protein